MSHPHNNSRKGISLVEMMITIILFAALATIALKYTKNFFDTGLASQKARIAALMEQGTQLSGAYDVFIAQEGHAPVLLSDLNDSNISINTKLPPIMTELSTRYWELNTTTGIGSGKAIQFTLDGNTSADDDNVYCAIFNHEFNKSIEFNVTNTTYTPGTAQTMYDSGFRQFCFSDTGTVGDTLRIYIVKP
jgi:prepilin-type N-terminal cleavage/methylation domain-containing protein